MRVPLKTVIELVVLLSVSVSSDALKQSRIMGGSSMAPHEFPAMVAIMQGTDLSFGGTLVGLRTVLTVAHNLKPIRSGAPKDMYSVLIGVHDLSQTYDAKHKYKIVDYKVFNDKLPLKEEIAPPDDIALIYLDRNVELSQLVGKAEIGDYTSLDADLMSQCVVAGWGLTSGDGVWSHIPKKARVNLLLPQEKCGKAVEEMTGIVETGQKPEKYGYRPESLCMNSIDGNQCYGDSGGPVMCQHPDENYKTQVGVISTTYSNGDGCGISLSVASSTIAHYDWITDNIRN